MTRRLKDFIWSFTRDASGATAIEYALIAALIAVGALGAMQALGGGLGASWGNTATKVSEAMK